MPPCRDICCRQLQSCCSDIGPAVSPLRRCIPAAFSRWQLQPDCPVQPSFSQLQPYCTLSPFLQPQSVSRIRHILLSVISCVSSFVPVCAVRPILTAAAHQQYQQVKNVHRFPLFQTDLISLYANLSGSVSVRPAVHQKLCLSARRPFFKILRT